MKTYIKSYFGNTWEYKVDDTHTMDVIVYPNKWYTVVIMELWEKDNWMGIHTIRKKYYNYNKIMPKLWAEWLAKRDLNKQSQMVAGIDIIE